MELTKVRLIKPWMLPAFAGYILGALLPALPPMHFLMFEGISPEYKNPLTSPGAVSAVLSTLGFVTGYLLWRLAVWTGRLHIITAAFVAIWIPALSIVTAGFLAFGDAYYFYREMPIFDSVMLCEFARHENTFNQLRVLTSADAQTFRLQKTAMFDGSTPIAGLSHQRLETYQRLFRELDIDGIDLSKAEGAGFVAWDSGGSWDDVNATKGFVYLNRPPVPLASNLDMDEGRRAGMQSGRQYRHIRGNWYLYFDFRADDL